MDNRGLSLSVIIPVYNDYLGLRNVLESIAVCYKNICSYKVDFFLMEVVIIDDGSSVDYSDLVLKFKNIFDLTYRKQSNGRQGKARNNGMILAKYDYLWFVDADDEMPCDALVHIFDSIWLSSNVDVVLFSANLYGLPFRHLNSDYKDVEHNLIAVADNKLIVAPWSKVYRKEFLLENAIFFPERLKFEDLYFSVVTLALAKSIVVSDKVIYRYIYNPTSTTKCHDISLLDVFDVIQSILDSEKISPSSLFISKLIYTHGVKYTCIRLMESRSIRLCVDVLSDVRFRQALKRIRFRDLYLKQNFLVAGVSLVSCLLRCYKRLVQFINAYIMHV